MSLILLEPFFLKAAPVAKQNFTPKTFKLKDHFLLAILLTLSSLMLFQLKKGRSVNVDNYRSSLLPTRDQAKLLNRAFTASIFRALFFSLREVQFFLAILE